MIAKKTLLTKKMVKICAQTVCLLTWSFKMATIIHRFTLCLTKENQRQLDELCKKLGENKNQVMMRALQLLYDKYEDKK